MKLLMKALEKRCFVSSSINGGFESEGFHILHSWWVYTIKKGDKSVSLDNEDIAQSQKAKDFKRLLDEFFAVSFPNK